MKTQLNYTICYHCGSENKDDAILYQEKEFCCSGCVSVYQVLKEMGLESFYEMEDRPGTRKYNHDPEQFAWLDEPETAKLLIKFSDENQSLINFYIPDIHCASCVWLLEKLPGIKAGIKRSEVDFLRKEVRIWFNHHQISIRSIVQLLAWIGYEPIIQLSEQKLDSEQRKPWRKTYLKLGLAGFAFGNVMLFSLPEYFGLDLYTPALTLVFTWLNALISIPVLVYSAEDFWKNAYMSLKGGRITMDVPITLGIVAMFARSVYELVAQIGPGYFDSFTGLIFFMLIGRLFQQKTYHAISFFRDYRSYFPMSVFVKSEDDFKAIPLSKLNKGDVIRVRNEELIPADSKLISEKAALDYHFVTGESAPVSIKKGEEVFAGGRLKGAEAQFLILKSVDQSYLTQLWNHDVFKLDKLTHHVSLSDRISPYFTWVILAISVLSFGYWFTIDTAKAVQVFAAVLIIACPCALALSVPFTMGSVLNVFSENGFYVRSERIVELLSKAKSIVFDKTGTLTEPNTSPVRFVGRTLKEEEVRMISAATKSSTHPLSNSIERFLHYKETPKADFFEEVKGLGLKAVFGSDEILIGNEAWLNQHEIETQDYIGNVTKTYLGINGHLFGCFVFEQTVRSGIAALISRLLKKGFRLVGLSGDVKPKSGEIKQIFESFLISHFDCKPDTKLEKIAELKNQHPNELVIMVGDGLNDAGALRMADVGIAISDDVHSFSPGCDAILDAKNLTKLDAMLELAKQSNRVIYASYTISLLYNIVGVSLAVMGILSPLITAIMMPLSSITVLVFTTSSVYFLALNRKL